MVLLLNILKMQLEIICRICLKNNRLLQPLFETNYLMKKETKSCAEMLNFCLVKDVKENDTFPQNICKQCIANLKSAYRFKKQCEDSYFKISEYLLNLEREQMKIDSGVKQEFLETLVDYPERDDESEKDELAISFNNRQNKIKIKRCSSEKEKRIKPTYYCVPCQKSFKNEKTHNQRLHSARNPVQCDRCAAIFLKPYSLTLHMRQHDNRLPYACPITGCGKAYAISSMLKNHMTTHTKEKTFICHYCSHSVRTKQQLMVHIRCHHTKEKIFKCRFCDKAYYSYHSKYNHERRHKSVRDYPCKLCKKSFLYASNLVFHMLTHTGEKNFECRVCGTKFSRKQHRDDHENNVHSVSSSTDGILKPKRKYKTREKNSLDL